MVLKNKVTHLNINSYYLLFYLSCDDVPSSFRCSLFEGKKSAVVHYQTISENSIRFAGSKIDGTERWTGWNLSRPKNLKLALTFYPRSHHHRTARRYIYPSCRVMMWSLLEKGLLVPVTGRVSADPCDRH